ncbi:PREDICTED: importin-13 isoform X2 [Papilio polytes]|uniref:importin-13 isoform X2 n=1 Tax=Papilio polytes TaxID=76194 RepID=UPI000675C533|nr:PREDICTED: importin-13 isoform X2 [Papilio polytes]
MEYTAQNLEYAVNVFYNGEQNEKTNAHTWLTTAQRAPEAWNFVWELLQPHKGTEIQFYAATTLHTKILRCWNEVPPESYEELKEKILQAVTSYSQGPKIVTNRLCISLAAVILQLGATDLATTLRPLSNVENTSLLLEVLTVIPEEYNSMTMGTALRTKNQNALLHACPAVLDDMLRYLQSVYNDYSKSPPCEETVKSWLNVATCAGSWLSMACADCMDYNSASVPDFAPLCRALLTVVHVLYSCSEAVSDVSLEACEAALSAVRAAGGGAGSLRRPVAAHQLLADLLQLADRVLARDNVPNSINEELVSAVITCLVSVADCHSRHVVRGVEAGQRAPRHALELLLAAQAAPGHYPLHETRSHFVFSFWYTLQDEISNTCDSKRGVPAVWLDVFSRLLLALVAKAEAPADCDLSQDDQELLRCYRQDISDTITYCFCVLEDNIWKVLEEAYPVGGCEARQEAVLFAFLAVGEIRLTKQALTPPIAALLQHAVGAARSARTAHLLDTALDCLGGYSSWLSSSCSLEEAELARRSISAAGAALQRSPARAAHALRKLCAECDVLAASMAQDIVSAAQSGMVRCDSFVRRQLAGAAGAALAAAPLDVAAPLLQKLAQPMLLDLRSQAAEGVRARAAAECGAALLTALSAAPALAGDLFQAMLPALENFTQHADLLEAMYKVLEQALSSLLEACAPHMPQVAQLTVAGFHTQPCAQGLLVLNLMMLISYETWPEAGRVLRACVSASAARAAADVRADPDLTSHLFLTLSTLTKKIPESLQWIEDLLSQLVELACRCVTVWEAQTARGACTWLIALAARRPAPLLPHAPALTAAAVCCIGGASPRAQVSALSELLLALNRAEWGAVAGAVQGAGLRAWLHAALDVDGFPSHHATHTHKQKFITAILKEKNNRRIVFEAAQEFSLVCRGLIGTEYARQTIAAKQLVA